MFCENNFFIRIDTVNALLKLKAVEQVASSHQHDRSAA
jgi:hypothetical protein